MIEWINNKFGTNFTENDLKNIKDFSLLWNIFENLVCERNCTINRIEENLNPIEFQIENFEDHLNYFKDRYRNNLFHGEKDFMLLNEQEENFSVANQVLTSILTHF